MRKYGKIDTNHSEIVAALRACGWLVLSLASMGHGIPDLLIYRAGKYLLAEVKHGKGKLTSDQVDFHAVWPVVILRTVDDVLALN